MSDKCTKRQVEDKIVVQLQSLKRHKEWPEGEAARIHRLWTRAKNARHEVCQVVCFQGEKLALGGREPFNFRSELTSFFNYPVFFILIKILFAFFPYFFIHPIRYIVFFKTI